MKNKTNTEQFCHDILNSNIKRAKALVNIIMALGSHTTASNPTSLSENHLFQYHYSIITKVMRDFGAQLNSENSAVFKSGLHQLLMAYAPKQTVYKLSSDFTPIRKPESPTLADRGFVHIPNCRIFKNKPIDIGYDVSCVNLGLYDQDHPHPWSLPLDNQRVGIDASKMEVAVAQLRKLLNNPHLPFGKSGKIINAADSAYAVPEYVSPLIETFDNLVLLIRLRHGMKVYKAYQGKQHSTGRSKHYEDKPYYLQTCHFKWYTHWKTKERFKKEQHPIFDLTPDVQEQQEISTKTGRQLIVQLFRWNDLLIPGKRKQPMHDKPFDLIGVRLVDKTTGECLFKRDMFLALWGKPRRSHTAFEAQQDYQHRYDIEPHNRFSKQQLLMDKYQTPAVESLDAWCYTVQLTFWLLYAASKETEICVKPWEIYLPEVKRALQKQERKSPAMTRKGAAGLFSTFDQRPFAPQKSKNGKGRKKGTTFPRRPWFSPRRKQRNQQNNKQKVEIIQ